MNKPDIVITNPLYDNQLLYFTCSSLSEDDEQIFFMSDRDGSPNVYRQWLKDGKTTRLSNNTHGYLKSYVYFDGDKEKGLSKASVSLCAKTKTVFFIMDNKIYRSDEKEQMHYLASIEHGESTAFTHVNASGEYLCVPTTDKRALDFDPNTEGYGLDKRPVYNIDGRVQKEKLSSYLNVYDTKNGERIIRKEIPLAWITHVQFNPVDPSLILYNNEWPEEDCGIRRLYLFDGKDYRQIRDTKEGRSRKDWVCHEMWSEDGKYLIYHGAYDNGPAFVGRYSMDSGKIQEIPLAKEYTAYGHFSLDCTGNLICDGYFKYPGDVEIVRDNSTDNGPDPTKKTAEYISLVKPNWEKKTLEWRPLCKHMTDWLGQDSHPHPIANHQGNRIYFDSRMQKTVGIYAVAYPSI